MTFIVKGWQFVAANASNWKCLAVRLLLVVAVMVGFGVGSARAQPLSPVTPVGNPCARSAQGAEIQPPPELQSKDGVLNAYFSFQTRTDDRGRQLYCFMTPDGLENPTLRLSPGEALHLVITNNTPVPSNDNPMTIDAPNCGDTVMHDNSVNIHYHGTNASPKCISDEVVKTIINTGSTFEYVVKIPVDEPSGLYWYHPHVHGISDPMVLGGATGLLIVDGIENFFPSLKGMPQQNIIVRDQNQYQWKTVDEGPGNCGRGVPFRDVTVNNVPVNSMLYDVPNAGIKPPGGRPAGRQYLLFWPANLSVIASQTQFWRVANTSADTILDISLSYDFQPQTLQVVAIDGVPVNSQDGTSSGPMIAVTHFRLPPASRVEFVATMPGTNVKNAVFMTQSIGTGPAGDCDPVRPLARIAAFASATPQQVSQEHESASTTKGLRFAAARQAPIKAYRTIYFSEDGETFYITVDGQTPKPFDPNQAPSIFATQGTVEQWVIQNRTQESHEFHIHQIHYLVKSQDNFGNYPSNPAINGQYVDMVDIPAWSGSASDPYPSVTLIMDFTGDVVGVFPFHCHILNHEDHGMMNTIQVNPAPVSTRSSN